MSKLNKIKELIIELAEYNFPETVFNEIDWFVRHDSDLDADFQKDFQEFCCDFKNLKLTLKNPDKYELLDFSQKISRLGHVFSNITDDVEKILWGDDGQLPDIPEDYVLPAHYNYISEA